MARIPKDAKRVVCGLCRRDHAMVVGDAVVSLAAWTNTRWHVVPLAATQAGELRCHPKRCGATYRVRSDRLVAAAEAAGPGGTIVLGVHVG